MKTTKNAAALESAANTLWESTTDSKVKYELRFVFELAGLGFESEAAVHLARAEALANVRVRKLTAAMCDHIETAIAGVEGYESVVLGRTYVQGTTDQLAGIATRLDDAADDAAMNIEMASLRDIPEAFLNVVAKRQAATIRKAAAKIRRAIGED